MNFEVYRAYKKFKKINKQELSIKLKWVVGLSIAFIICTIVYLLFYEWVGILSLSLLALILVLIISENRRVDSTPDVNFKRLKVKRKSLCIVLNKYNIIFKDDYVKLLEWNKSSILEYENRVKKTFSVLGTITFSGLLTLVCSILPSVFDNDAKVPESLLSALGFVACILFSLFLLFVGIYSAEYFDYLNKKSFVRELQDIIDYNIYDEVLNENNKTKKDKQSTILICKKNKYCLKRRDKYDRSKN